MKINLKNTPEQVELIKALGSKNKLTSLEAQEALAAFIAPVARQVIEFGGTANLIYTQSTYNEDDQPSVPLDLYYNEGVDYAQVWQQNMAGGVPTNQVYGIDELLVSTYRLDSAVSMLKKYARKARLDVVSKTISKMLNEVLIKQEKNQWSILLKALAEATDVDGNTHLISATTANVFQIDDLNRLFTKVRRINAAFNAGTPAASDSRGLTDIFVSPEILEDIRAFAYEPMNTRAVPNTDESTAVPLPDAVRQKIYDNAGASEIYGVLIHEVLEFGDNRVYNNLFDTFYSGTPSFTGATDQLVLGVDKGRESCLKLVAQNADSGDTFVAVPDDQFLSRSEKIGWYGSVEQGNVVVDARALCGVVV